MTTPPQPLPTEPDDDLKAFLLVLRRSLLSIVVFIEKKYEIGDAGDEKRRKAA